MSMMSAQTKAGIRALSKEQVGEWLEKRGASKEDVNYLKSKCDN